MAQKIKVSHIKGYRLQNQKINGTSRGIFLVQPTELAENNRKGDEMNYIVGFIFIALIGYIFEQHRRIHYLVKRNIEQEN
ncbi:hypothetical protein ACI78P_01615 [Leuconostoc mesenteroides]|uniref:hypothetical protein n=1 Tax=Leuconostoc mesenteroides TaxID=1245 RepID=UPI00385D6141